MFKKSDSFKEMFECIKNIEYEDESERFDKKFSTLKSAAEFFEKLLKMKDAHMYEILTWLPCFLSLEE